jgi:hypothetical protein
VSVSKDEATLFAAVNLDSAFTDPLMFWLVINCTDAEPV